MNYIYSYINQEMLIINGMQLNNINKFKDHFHYYKVLLGSWATFDLSLTS